MKSLIKVINKGIASVNKTMGPKKAMKAMKAMKAVNKTMGPKKAKKAMKA